MSTRICVVTGGNKGIGFAVVKQLCEKFKGIVYLTSRDVTRGKEAVEKLAKLGLSPHYHQLDITDQASINTFAAYVRDTYGGLDVLVNNAAIAFKKAATEPPAIQAEVTTRCNYFGTLNLWTALFPLFRDNAKIVNVSSVAGCFSFLPGKEPECTNIRKRFEDVKTIEDVTNLMNEFVGAMKDGSAAGKGWPTSSYGMSKVGINALTVVQQRIMDADSRSNISVNSCHPGYVDTDMTSHQGPLTPDEGAKSTVYLATIPPEATEPKGCFHGRDCRIGNWIHEKVSI